MKELARQLRIAIDDYEKHLKKLSEEEFSKERDPSKWTRKQELGHLVDSGHSNLRRFVISQYEMNPKVTYNQDEWVRLCNYQNISSTEIITLWSAVNKLISEVFMNMKDGNENLQSDTGKDKVELHSLKWLAEDYIKHMKHHLHHILDMEPVPY